MLGILGTFEPADGDGLMLTSSSSHEPGLDSRNCRNRLESSGDRQRPTHMGSALPVPSSVSWVPQGRGARLALTVRCLRSCACRAEGTGAGGLSCERPKLPAHGPEAWSTSTRNSGQEPAAILTSCPHLPGPSPPDPVIPAFCVCLQAHTHLGDTPAWVGTHSDDGDSLTYPLLWSQPRSTMPSCFFIRFLNVSLMERLRPQTLSCTHPGTHPALSSLSLLGQCQYSCVVDTLFALPTL